MAIGTDAGDGRPADGDRSSTRQSSQQVTNGGRGREVLVFLGDPDFFDPVSRGEFGDHIGYEFLRGGRAGSHTDGATKVVWKFVG